MQLHSPSPSATTILGGMAFIRRQSWYHTGTVSSATHAVACVP